MEKQKGPGRDWLRWLISLFGLDEFGQENLPRLTRLTLAQFALALLVIAVLDLIVWTNFAYLSTENWFAGVVIGLIATVVIASVNRMIIVQAPLRKWQRGDGVSTTWFSRIRLLAQPALFVGFIALTIALTHYTALTFSVMTFKSEIEKQIALTESHNHQALVDGAVEKVEREFGRQIESQEKEGARAAQEVSVRTSADIEAYKKQRAVERATRVDSHDAAILIQKEAAQRSEQERNEELDQGAGVRASGAGKFYRTKEANYTKQQEQLQKLQEAKIQELRTFDEETLKHVASKEAARDSVIAESAQAVQRLRSEMQAKVKQLRSAPIGSVPGEWRVARGFAAQKLALAQIEESDKTGTMTTKRLESHVLMLIFGLMSILLKIGLGSKVRAYFNPYTRIELGEKQQALDRALEAFTMRLHMLAGPVPGSGRFRRLSTIQAQLQAAWLELVVPAQKELLEFERRVYTLGVEKAAEVETPQASWVTSEEQLRELGWQPPTEEDRRSLEAAFQKLVAQREQLLAQTRTIEAKTAEIALGAYEAVMSGFERLRSSHEQQLLVIASQIVAAEAVVKAYDEAVPAWDGGSPGNFLAAFWQRLEERMVLVALRKTREKFLEIARESDRQMAILLQEPTTTISQTPRSLSHQRRRDYDQKLLPLQVMIEQLEARCDVIPDWHSDPRPFSDFWEVGEERMLALGWIPPRKNMTPKDLES